MNEKDPNNFEKHDGIEPMNNEMLDDFEEKYGSTEDFSKRAVGSLFDEPASVKPDAKPEKPPRLRSDPEEDYAKYLQSSREDIQNEMRRKEAAKEKAITRREEQLAELSKEIGGKRPISEDDVYVYAGDKSKRNPRTRPMPPINVRNVAALGLFVVLIIFAVLVWQLAAANSRLADANAQIAEMDEELISLRDLRTVNAGLNTEVMDLRAEVLDLLAALAVPPSSIEDDPDEIDVPNVDTPQTGTQPAAGRTHVVRDGDTLWGIAAATLGNGARYPEILAYNNLPANASPQPGQVLRIPD